jgi:uncharacterized protein (DUF2062 family)
MMKIVNIKDKIVFSFYKLLKQGLSPIKLALVIALGMTLSVFPVLGVTTLICTLVALLFHLNLPAIQFANYAAFPFQVILFFPFLKLGKSVSQASLAPLSKVQLIATFEEGFFYAIQELSQYLIIACLGWVLVSIPIFIIFFYLLWVFLKNYRPIFEM